METSLLARLLGAARAVAPLAPVNPAALSLPQLGLGQTIRAQVAARLADGSFRVVVNDAPLKILLPSGTKAGDTITLRVVAHEPHLQFEVDRGIESVQPRLSGAGRLIGQVLREPIQQQAQQAQPVTPAPVADAAKLNEPLAHAIQRSGLFYESHQARWIAGEYPLALLREEPQNAMPGLRRPIDQQVAASALALRPDLAEELDDLARQPREQAADDLADFRDRNGARSDVRPQDKSSPSSIPAATRPTADALPEDQPGDAAASAAARAAGNAISRVAHDEDPPQAKIAGELLPVVRQQLEALESRQIVWQGELWPGQPIRWQIAERETDPQHAQARREWLTRFVLRLPDLGEIGADLAIGARGVRILVTAKDSAAADALRAAAPELAHSLEAAGLRVATLEVRQHAR